jgi:hypothetical protein
MFLNLILVEDRPDFGLDLHGETNTQQDEIQCRRILKPSSTPCRALKLGCLSPQASKEEKENK